MKETYIGIDLGTTTTLIARAQEGADNKISVKVFPIGQNDGSGKEREMNYLPSLAYLNDDGKLVVGLEAQNRGPENPSRLVRAVKRQMGRRIILPEIGKQPYEISALYLEKALREGKKQFPLEKIIFTVTVPASFTSKQRADTLQALRIACKEAGVPYPQKEDGSLFISEPIAAMLAFLNKEFELPKEVRKLDFEKEHRIIVYDVGGGTLDLTIVYLEPKNHEQPVQKLADLTIVVDKISKYNPFGGEDFDLSLAEVLAGRMMEKFPKLQEIVLEPRMRAGVKLQLMNFAKEIKEAMSSLIDEQSRALFDDDVDDTHYYNKPIKIVAKEYSLEGELTIAEYRDIVRGLTDIKGSSQKNLIAPLRDLLLKNKSAPQGLSGILIVGGMALLPLVKEAIEEYWKSDDKVLTFDPPDHAVVAGAAVYSCLRQKYPEFSLKEYAADAYYVWLEKNGVFDPILPSNKDAGEKIKYNLTSESKRLKIDIFAGEDSGSGNQPIEETSLIYQGRLSIDLKKTYNEGDPVWIQMLYTDKDKQDHTKVPWVHVWLKDPANQEEPDCEYRYTEFLQEAEDEENI